jgi:hypothetical protein
MASTIPPQVVFSRDVAHMKAWSDTINIPMTTADALGMRYTRAHRWLKELRNQLISQYGWAPVAGSDARILFDITCPTPIRTANGFDRTPPLHIQIPAQATSFFNEERITQWQMVFHGVTFSPNLRRTIPPISDLLSLLQCLLTGMLVLVQDTPVPGGCDRIERALPSAEWVATNQAKLVDIFGAAHYKSLLKAASDRKTSFKLARC